MLKVLYGRTTASVAEQLNCSVEEAEQIKSSVFKGFPAIKKFEEDSIAMAKELGYVTTLCGGKRRLPDMQLEPFTFKWVDGYVPVGDILDFDTDDVEIPLDRINYYLSKLESKYCSVYKLKEQAREEHIEIIDNRNKIADATRQCVNARIQGTAAQLTKLAMIKLSQDKHLKELGFRMLIPVHDRHFVQITCRV